MPAIFDVVIAGLGAMGSAAASHLARRGLRVAAFDRFRPPHTFGSSHGQTRIIREAYFEHPAYVPLIQRAYELWLELEKSSGRQLFRQTGGLMIGAPDSTVVRGARRSAKEHRLPHAVLTAPEVRRRFPAQRLPDNFLAVLEPRAGILFPEECISAHLQSALAHGAEVHFEQPIEGWETTSGGIRVRTPDGTCEAGQLVVSAGNWTSALLPDLRLPLTVERQTLHWFDPVDAAGAFDPDRCPVYLWEHEPDHYFYGFPDLGDGIKVAAHHGGEIVHPDRVDRTVHPSEIVAMRSLVERFLPGANGRHRNSVVCCYTNTPDQHFLIDRHPLEPRVWIASPCSGHGFKFSSVIGEILADLVTQERSRFDLSLFRHRFRPT